MLREANWVDGAWIGAGGATLEVRNPATGDLLATVPDAGGDGAARAIAAAERALPAWRALPAAERARLLRRMHDLALEQQGELARLLTAEQGKPLAEARAEIGYAASYLDWYAGEAVRVRGETIPALRADQRIVVVRQPVGVCAAITPWNFPSAMLARKLAPALAAGCTLVAKPAELTPLSGLAWGVLAEQAGLPAGVLNVITGAPEPIGRAFMESTAVRKVSFTGSTEVGKLLIGQAAATVKRLSLELGGNAPFLVFADADLEAAARGLMASKYRASGQTCVCANRILVERPVAAAFTERVVAASRTLVVGDGSRDGVDLGPLIDDQALAKVRRLVGDAVDRGAQLALGALPDRRMCPPIVLTGVTADMAVAREEVFGPVVALQTFDGEAEAVALANDTRAGLAAYVYTGSGARAVRVAEALDYGMVGVNEGIISNAAAPFGGIKESGWGREGGHQGIDEYLDTKYVCTTL
ncbi:MAG TPA: NAD-dependent succinate-semialdehyde dehydrogenase [Kofleriaceae bacterium]|nr:NAD-dependent succinate-semialdehyde dehydrogenase [Kofleriaceae bacterium]